MAQNQIIYKRDKIISTNSIIPSSRREVIAMYTSIHGTLKTNGQFVVYLPSFTLCKEILEKYPELKEGYEGRMDYVQYRFHDTIGCQCFHTEELILKELERAGFNKTNIFIEEVQCESNDEAIDLSRLYRINLDLIKKEFSCFFVIAKK